MNAELTQTIARHNCRFYRDLLGRVGILLPISNYEIMNLSNNDAIALERGLFIILCAIPEEACDE